MKILICSDGTATADSAIALGKLLAPPLQAEMTLLGIAEKSDDEQPLREALEKQADALRGSGASPQLTVQYGEPVRQIVDLTREMAAMRTSTTYRDWIAEQRVAAHHAN